MTLPRTRCAWSDLHTDECGHCRGDDGTPGVYVAAAPVAARERWHPPTLSVQRGRPEPSPLTARYPLLCALGDGCRPQDRGGPRQVGGRSHLCPVCEDATRDRLLEVADAWPDMQARLTAIRALAFAGFVTGDSPGTGIVLDEAASDAMREAGLAAHFYTRVVMRERGHTPPDATPVGLMRWLARNHVPWLCAHPDAGVAEGFAGDAAGLARRARSAAYPAGWRTIPVPLPCPARVAIDDDNPDDGDRACAGRMTARIRPDLHRLPDLVCDTNPAHTIGPDVWQRNGWKHAARNERAHQRLIDAIRGA